VTTWELSRKRLDEVQVVVERFCELRCYR